VREAFQQWVQTLWREKDARIDALLAVHATPGAPPR
jgi:hypothetical protein